MIPSWSRLVVARWAVVNHRGEGSCKSVAHLARFDLTLRNGADGVYFEVDSPGCYEQPRHLRRLPDEADKLVLEEILPYETPGEFRKRIYVSALNRIKAAVI